MEHGSSIYGVMFAEMLQKNVRSLVRSSWQRDRNPGAPFSFGENHLRKEIKSYTPPPDWPRLIIERHVNGDFVEPGRRHGGVDFFFVAKTSLEPLGLLDVLATCEVGGPTRPQLLRGSRENWYPKIVNDIRKQLWRARMAPKGEHYVGLMIKPGARSVIRQEFLGVLDSMLKDVPGARLAETSWVELTDVNKLNVIVLRVLPKQEL